MKSAQQEVYKSRNLRLNFISVSVRCDISFESQVCFCAKGRDDTVTECETILVPVNLKLPLLITFVIFLKLLSRLIAVHYKSSIRFISKFLRRLVSPNAFWNHTRYYILFITSYFPGNPYRKLSPSVIKGQSDLYRNLWGGACLWACSELRRAGKSRSLRIALPSLFRLIIDFTHRVSWDCIFVLVSLLSLSYYHPVYLTHFPLRFYLTFVSYVTGLIYFSFSNWYHDLFIFRRSFSFLFPLFCSHLLNFIYYILITPVHRIMYHYCAIYFK